MKILPISSLPVCFTKIVKLIETTTLNRANQRHALHYLVNSLDNLPTPIVEKLNHYLQAPTAQQYPHTDAHMRLLLALNHKLKPHIKISQLLALRQKFATELVALQSPTVWHQTGANDKTLFTTHKNKCPINIYKNFRYLYFRNLNPKPTTLTPKTHTVRWQDKLIANADGGDMRIRCYELVAANGHNRDAQNPDQAVMLFFHGGGFCMGDVNTHHEFCHSICAQTGWAIVSIDYRLAPEHPAPTAIRDCLEAYIWLAAHAHTLNASSSRIVLAGDSSGGGLAALVAQQVSHAAVMHSANQQSDRLEDDDELSRDIFQQLQNLPLPLAQLLLYPITDIGTDYPSWKLYGQGLILDYNDVQVFHAAYLQECSLTQPHALLSPMNGDNTHLCPSYIIVAELDMLHDEALVYAEQLRHYGIKVQTHTVLGAPHGFINLMSVHQGMGRETLGIIHNFAKFVQQIIRTEAQPLPYQ